MILFPIKIKIRYFLFILYMQSILAIDETEMNIEYKIKEKNLFELNSSYIITRIVYTKSNNYFNNYLFGIFLVSNNTNFSDAVPISMIKINSNELLIPNNQISSKYIRYIPPNINSSSITPIILYGKNSSIIDDITYFQATNLPLILVNTENNIEPLIKEKYIKSKIILINEGKININQTGQIKVRGHSTSVQIKKPLKIKFDKKQEIPGIKGKFKKWTLLANSLDKSLIRNILAFKISELMEFEFTPRCIPTDLILNWNFRGTYFICDQIEVNENRVNIDKMDIFDISYPNITGGYLLEFDLKIFETNSLYEKSLFLTDRGLVGGIKHPDSDIIHSKQFNYINKFLNTMEKNVYNGNLTNIDLFTFSKFFLIEEFCGDIDFVLSSFYFYKKRNIDKIYFGPVWDFDLAFDNHELLIPTNDKNVFCFNFGDSAGSLRDFIKTLLKNKNVMNNIKKTWKEFQEKGIDINNLKNFIEDKKNLLSESAGLNFLKWYNSTYGEEKDEFFKNVDVLVNYIEKRFDKLTFLLNNYNNSVINMLFSYIIILYLFFLN